MASEYTGKPFPPLKNDLLLRVAKGEKVERIPVWVMRQAGRYLPEFQEVRKKHGFFEICQTPELACEVTLQPINRFLLDAAIIFSDILVIPQAMGMKVEMLEGKGPHFPTPLTSPDQLLDTVDVRQTLSYVYNAITMTRHKLEGCCPLLGFAGAPWTLFSYMVEGGSSTTQSKAKRWLYTDPESSHKILRKIADVVIDHLSLQVLAGAQAVQVFESHAGALSPDLFTRFALPYLKDISEGVRNKLQQQGIASVPMILFPKDGHYALEQCATAGYEIIGLDWTIKPMYARRLVGSNIVLQGNLDPCALYSNKDDLRALVKQMLQDFGTSRYICNLGHGIYPDVNPDNMKEFITAVREISELMIK